MPAQRARTRAAYHADTTWAASILAWTNVRASKVQYSGSAMTQQDLKHIRCKMQGESGFTGHQAIKKHQGCAFCLLWQVQLVLEPLLNTAAANDEQGLDSDADLVSIPCSGEQQRFAFAIVSTLVLPSDVDCGCRAHQP